MLNLYQLSTKNKKSVHSISANAKASVYYHSIFDFPLTFSELTKWSVSDKMSAGISNNIQISTKNRYFYLDTDSDIVYKRELRKRISAQKFKIARYSAKIIGILPSVKMVGITGSLAMENAVEDSDIDIIIFTKKGTLWTTRAFVYLFICLFKIKLRRPRNKNQRDALCLNMWLDESDLIWRKDNRNLYTAHEIAQIVPLVNKDGTHEKFLYKNKWILNYWPNAVEKKYIVYSKSYIGKDQYTTYNILNTWLENICFRIQYKYMESKITREQVSRTRALFHPQDWGQIVLNRLST